MSVKVKMTAIADAIRSKTGGTTKLTLDQMAIEIEGIETGIELPTLSNEGSASDLLSGKQLIDQEGNVVTGTIPTKGATTYTPKTSDQTIDSGTYLTGTQTIKGDSNLVAGNIKSGVSIFGVTGNYAGSGGGSGGGVETSTVYLPGITGYEATVFENGAITYKSGRADTVENVVRNSIFNIKHDLTDMRVDGGSLLLVTNPTGDRGNSFILVTGSILDIYLDSSTGEEEIPDL